MSQSRLSSFDWPTAAPGAPQVPALSFAASPSTPKVLLGIPDTMSKSALIATTFHMPSITQSHNAIIVSSTERTAFGTLTSAVVRTVDASVAAKIHQTWPLDLHAPMIPTKVRTPVLEATTASFHLSTIIPNPFVPVLGNPTFAKSNPGPTPSPMSSDPEIRDASPRTLSPAAIAGVTLGLVAFLGILIALIFFLYRRRKAKKAQSDTEASKSKDTLAEKMERSRERRRKRWAPQETAMNKERFEKLKELLAAKNREAAKNKASVVENLEGEEDTETKEVQQKTRPGAGRRPSGLAMHPPTPVSEASMDHGDVNIGRAV